jgi:hypothetical protein
MREVSLVALMVSQITTPVIDHELTVFAVWKEADTRQNWWRYQGKHLLV